MVSLSKLAALVYIFFGRKSRRTCPFEFFLWIYRNGFNVKYLPIVRRFI